MSNVIDLNKFRDDNRVEAEFVKLLNKETKVDGNVKPLSVSLISRMEALKAKAEQAKARTELLEM